MSLNAWAKAKLIAAAKAELPGDGEDFVAEDAPPAAKKRRKPLAEIEQRIASGEPKDSRKRNTSRPKPKRPDQPT